MQRLTASAGVSLSENLLLVKLNKDKNLRLLNLEKQPLQLEKSQCSRSHGHGHGLFIETRGAAARKSPRPSGFPRRVPTTNITPTCSELPYMKCCLSPAPHSTYCHWVRRNPRYGKILCGKCQNFGGNFKSYDFDGFRRFLLQFSQTLAGNLWILCTFPIVHR